MKLKDYEKMSLEELHSLYFGLSKIIRDVLKDNKESTEQLAELKTKREELIITKNQVLEIINSNSISKDKKIGYILTALGVLSTGVLTYLVSPNTDSSSISQAAAGASTILTAGCGMGAYTAFYSSSYDKKLVQDNNILYLNPEISKLESKITTLENRIKLNNQILKRANTSLQFLSSRINELFNKELFNNGKQKEPNETNIHPSTGTKKKVLSLKSTTNQ